VSVPKIPAPAKLVVSVLGADWDAFWTTLEKDLESAFGPADYLSPALPFGYTSYYDGELGTPITRRLVGFARLAPHDGLPDAKLAACAMEKKHARPDGSRTCNIDPGFVTQERLVLATGKNFTHRIYLGKGVFADLTLIYQGKDWVSLPWTFRDYADPVLQQHLTSLRNRYREQLDNLNAPNAQGQPL